MLMRLLFGQTYFLRFDPKLYAAMQPYPPLGTLYAASYMRERGYEVALFDAMLADSTAEWEAKLQATQPDTAILYEDNFNYLSKMCLLNMREAAFEMIAMAKKRDLPTIVCGADATDHAEAYLDAGADYVLLGEGEETLAELLAHLENADSTNRLESIVGLAYKIDGKPVRNLRRPDIKDLDALPFPAWDLVDVEKYRQVWLEKHGYYSINMVTTRGCPFHCNWCAKPIWGQRYHSRSPENVAAELRWLKELVNPDHIWFADDIMGLKPRWFEKFADIVERDGTRTPFKCLSRSDLILRKNNDVEAMARAGCDIVWMGAESGSQKVLDAMEKGTTVEQIIDSADLLHKHNIRVGFFLQFGYPGETRADIDRTFEMIKRANPDDVGMSVSYPLPGTSFFERVKLELGDKQNWSDSADLAMLYRGPFTTDFYRHLHTVLHKVFRSQKTVDRWKTLIRNPRDIRRHDVRELAATVYRRATLPFARRKLDQLAQLPHAPAIVTLPHMTQAEAAQPTPQE